MELHDQHEVMQEKNEQLVQAQRQLETHALALEKASRYKSEFLANISHELRTPLNSLLILSKLLADNEDENLTAEQVEFAEAIHIAGNDLLALINDVLDISKVEAGKLAVAPGQVLVTSMLDALILQFRAQAAQKKLEFELIIDAGVPKLIQTDRLRLEQILRNLLTNAIKFTGKGSVRLRVAAQPLDHISFAVIDTGIGIDSQQLQKIFEPFFQSDSTTSRRYGGAGLGLSISRQLAELLGGRIEVTSEPFAGSVFTLVIPIRYQVNAGFTSASGAAVADLPFAPVPTIHRILPASVNIDRNRSMADNGAPKVLLVDDIYENLLALTALLTQLDIEVVSTTSAKEAKELLLQQNDFALAVIDVQMPEINGFELAESMRSIERTRHIPIVFVSAGSAEAGYTFKGYECGAIDFLYKPLDSHTVKSKVQMFIDLYLQRRFLNEQVIELQQAQQEQQRLLDELRKTQDELHQAMRLRDDFISLISHELRTPLNTMKLELYTRQIQMERGVEGAFTPENVNRMIANDERQLDRLVHLINDMTDVSRIRTGQLSMRPAKIDLSELLLRITDQFSAQVKLAGSQIRLHGIETSIMVLADDFRIEQAILNLLTNAIRYCESKPIEIVLDELGELVRISVRDYGKGIDPDDQLRIFNQFERGPNERKGSGLGLGLFIASQIAHAHGGALAVESRLGEGALFTLTLPKNYSFPQI